MKNEEWLPLVNKNGEVIGKAPRSECHKDKTLLHPVVHLHIFNSAGDIYLQKRPASKLVQPGKWDTAVGGHVSYGETIDEAMKKEMNEELGLENIEFSFHKKYIWKSAIERELIHIFIAKNVGTITINTDEVDEGRFWTLQEIKQGADKDIFTPNFIHEFDMIMFSAKEKIKF